MNALPLTQYDLQGNLIATYNSLREAERMTGLKAVTIADHCASGKPLDGYMWQAPCHRQTKAEKYRSAKRRAEMRRREALETNHYRDMENLLSLLHEPEKAIVGHLMQQALVEGGSPRRAFANWYCSQSEIIIDSDAIVDALYPNGNRPDRRND